MVRRWVGLLALLAFMCCVAVATAATTPARVSPAAADSCPVAKPGNGNSGETNPGNGNGNGGNSGNGNSGTGSGNSGNGNSGSGNSGNGNGNSGSGNSGNGNGNGGNSGSGSTGPGNSGNGAGNGNSGSNGNGNGNSSNGNSGNGNTGNGNGNSGSGGTPTTTPGSGTSGGGSSPGSSTTGGSAPDANPICVNPEPGDVAGDGTLPEPVAGQSVNVEAAAGVVLVRQPGTDDFVPLDGSAQLPTGTVLDARNGAVELTSAGRKDGVPQTAAFSGAKFELRQDASELRKSGADKAPVTEIVLRGGDFKGCPRLNRSQRRDAIRGGLIYSARSKRTRRSVWGSGHGNFRTRGRWGSATVRGTVWQVEDSCAGTLTTVYRGKVDVSDLGTGRTVAVEAGESYFARVR